jgi:hypothetical protein
MITLLRPLILALCFAAGLLAQGNSDWTEPFPPHRVIGNVYYVGSRGLASYLITTSQGHSDQQQFRKFRSTHSRQHGKIGISLQ